MTGKQQQQQDHAQLLQATAAQGPNVVMAGSKNVIIENAPPAKEMAKEASAQHAIPNGQLRRLAFSQKGMSNIRLDDDTTSTTSTAPTLVSSTSSGFWSLSESSISFEPSSPYRHPVSPSRSKSAPRGSQGKQGGDFRIHLRKGDGSTRPLANRVNAAQARPKQNINISTARRPLPKIPAGDGLPSSCAKHDQSRRIERAHLPKRPQPTGPSSPTGKVTATTTSKPRVKSQIRQRPTSADADQADPAIRTRPQRVKGRVASTDDSLSFKDFYRVSHEIDRGSQARVYEAHHRYSGARFAVKVIDRRSLSRKADDAVFREARILQELQNKQRPDGSGPDANAACGFVRLVDFFIEPTKFFLVMDYCAGGPVFDRVLDKHFYSEDDARTLAFQILKAVAFMHRHNVAHRDLKPQNILLCGDSDTDVKIADFGFATFVRPVLDEKTGKMTRRVLRQKCGTPSYVAPEVISGKGYDQAIDMWSLGVIFFFVLGGYPPFVDYNSRAGMFKKIMAGEFEFHETDWKGVSSQARDFIKALLVVDPAKRMTASQALYHPWILGSSAKLTSHPSSKSTMAKDISTIGGKKNDKVKSKGMRKLKAAFGGAIKPQQEHLSASRLENRRRTASPVQ
jgi:calcium/calmodulin-dependent protein kinase I